MSALVGLHTPNRPRSLSRTRARSAASTTSASAEEVADWDILTPDVINKYKMAAQIADQVMEELLTSEIQAGKTVASVCQRGDALMRDKTARVFTKHPGIEKGIAFPTCVSLNNIAGHFAPGAEDTRVFAEGDLAKVDLGVHIDGYIVCCANTTIVARNKQIPMTGRKADAICAAYNAANAALKLLVPGGTNAAVTNAMERVAGCFECRLAQGVLSHQMKRYLMDGERVIIGQREPGVDVPLFEFNDGEIYCVDVVVSTGDGVLKETDHKITVYRRNVHASYNLKQSASRQVYSDIKARFAVFPFPLREIESAHHRLGLVECINHALLDPFPVLAEKPGEYVAQFKFTAMVTSTGARLLSKMAVPFVHSDFTLDTDTERMVETGRSLKRKMDISSE